MTVVLDEPALEQHLAETAYRDAEARRAQPADSEWYVWQLLRGVTPAGDASRGVLGLDAEAHCAFVLRPCEHRPRLAVPTPSITRHTTRRVATEPGRLVR